MTELVDRYLEQHQVEPWTLEVLTWKLGKVKDAFGEVPVRRPLPEEIGAWRMRIPEGHRFETTQALRQVLDAAVRWEIVSENVAKAVPNPQPKRPEIRPFESWKEVEAVADELGPWPPWRSSRPERVFGRKSSSRSSGETSTARPASFTSGERSLGGG